MLHAKRLTIAYSLMTLLFSTAFAQEYKVVVPQLSPATIQVYTDIAKAVIEAGGNTAVVQTLPFARCIYLMETKAADIEALIVPITNESKISQLKYDYSTAEVGKIVFVLYYNKNKPIKVEDLKKGNPKGYKIETDVAHVDHFPFDIMGSTSFEASIKKVDSGMIDGFIFAQPSVDAALKRLGLKNVARAYYDTFQMKFIIQKGQKGGPIDKMLTNGLAKIKANGTYDKIMSTYNEGAAKYKDWQP